LTTKRNHIVFFFFAVIMHLTAAPQQQYNELFTGAHELLNARLYTYKTPFHPDIQPYNQIDIYKAAPYDSLFNYSLPEGKKALKKILSRHIITYDDSEVSFTADPLIDAIGGYDFSGKKALFESGIGAGIDANFYDKVYAGGTIMYHQSSFPDFVDDKIIKAKTIPGHAYAYKSPLGGYNYLDYNFYLSYRFLKYFNVEAGFGKNFWGDGYRTLFLSEAAYNYPYLKITTSVWNIKFINLYTNFKDMSGITSSRWKKMPNKFGAFHYLSFDISKRVNFGFFESVIWQEKDSSGNRGFDFAYINPIIFLRPVEFQRGSPDNSLLGVSLRVKVGKKTSLYGQLLIDDIIFGEVTKGIINRVKRIINHDSTLTYGYWTNKQAWQIGVKSYDLFKIKNLSAQLEFNFVRPYTYAHRIVMQNYGHYNQPLAHPAGANFSEAVFFLRYSYRRWFFEAHINYIRTGLDAVDSDFGQDIYKPAWDAYDASIDNVVLKPYFNTIGQGIKTNISYYSIDMSYLLNPKNNLRFVFRYYYRRSASEVKSNSANVISLGIRMSVPNPHFDY